MLVTVLAQVLHHRGPVDALFCVAGHVNPKPSSELRPQDWDAAWRMNVGYVTVAWHALRDSLEASDTPILATIGSFWSVNTGLDTIVPHIVTKHALRTYTLELASNHSWLAANHYCLPVMDGARYGFVSSPVSPKRAAECVVKNAFARQRGLTYMIEPDDTVYLHP